MGKCKREGGPQHEQQSRERRGVLQQQCTALRSVKPRVPKEWGSGWDRGAPEKREPGHSPRGGIDENEHRPISPHLCMALEARSLNFGGGLVAFVVVPVKGGTRTSRLRAAGCWLRASAPFAQWSS